MPKFQGVLGDDNAVHLLRRAGFGPKGGEWKRFAKKTADEAFDILWKPAIRGKGPKDDLNKHQRLGLKKMLSNRHRMREKLALFWHDHFGVNIRDVGGGRTTRVNRMRKHLRTLRQFGIGDPNVPGTGTFRELCLEMTRDQAMLNFLDGEDNRFPDDINENYGRELMELFMLGVKDLNGNDNYSQTDVHEMSRCVTGFDDLSSSSHEEVGRFRSQFFDPGSKTIFAGNAAATTGNLGVRNDSDTDWLPAGQNVVDIALQHRDTDGEFTAARFIARKLWEFYAYPIDPAAVDPTDDVDLIDELVTAVVDSGTGDFLVQDLLRKILTEERFYSERARSSSVKNPIEYALQAIRALKVQTKLDDLVQQGDDDDDTPGQLGDMQMNPFLPPSVSGWRNGIAWVATGPWLVRVQLAQDIASGRDPKRYKFKPQRIVNSINRTNPNAGPSEIVDAFLAELHLKVGTGAAEIPSTVKAELDAYLLPNTTISEYTEDDIETKIRGLVVLLLTLPEFHIH
jgi:uncharacterized protein (DUF1800 family)